MIINDNIFIGIEIEGPDIGIKTMFIPYGQGYTIHREAIIPLIFEHKITRFYFGAGEAYGVTDGDIGAMIYILHLSPNAKIMVEFTENEIDYIHYIPISLRKKIELIFVIKNKKLIFEINHIKFINKKEVVWYEITTAQKTDLKNTQYSKDKII